MHDYRKYPRNSLSQTPVIPTEEMQATIGTVVSAQLEFMQSMNQCALTWLSLPAVIAEAYATGNEVSSSKADPTNTGTEKKTGSGMDPSALAATVFWPTATVVSGIEDTLNDQFFMPRPPEADIRERDIMTLWKRSNEFEQAPYPVSVEPSGNQRAA